MTQRLITNWKHSPSKNQVAKVPVKEVPNLLQESSQLTVEDLLGLSWTLFEEEDE